MAKLREQVRRQSRRQFLGLLKAGQTHPAHAIKARTGQELATPDRHDLPTSQVEGPAKMTNPKIATAIGARHSLPTLGGFDARKTTNLFAGCRDAADRLRFIVTDLIDLAVQRTVGRGDAAAPQLTPHSC